MDAARLTTLRMHHQVLWGTPLNGPEEVVGRLGAMQAQEFVPATWSVGQRCRDTGQNAVLRAFDSGAILRTHLLRPTWHFVRRQDARWLLDLTAPRVNVRNAHMYRRLGLDEEAFSRSNALLIEALRGNEHLTRAELAEHLGRGGMKAEGLTLGYLLMGAELDAVICSGPRRGKRQTYALFDERVPAADGVPVESGLAELTRRYFHTRGPATVQDFVRWSSLTVAQARDGLSLVGDELERSEEAGTTFWSGPGRPVRAPASPRVDLVQGYDEYVMSYGESRGALLSLLDQPPGLSDRPPFLHAILLDGRLIGHWKPGLTRSRVEVEAFFYRPLDRAENAAMEKAAERLATFFGVAGSWTSVLA